MFARVSTIQGVPAQSERGVQGFRNAILPAAKQMAGFKGAYLLADSTSGKMVGITLWETREALDASASAADRLRTEGQQSAGATVPPTVEVYEVAVHP